MEESQLTPIEKIINIPTIETFDGTNITDVEAHIKPNNIEITYLSKK